MKQNNKNNKTVIRAEKVGGKFTTIEHRIIKDKRLSTDARLLLISILSDSDTFDLSRTGQMKRLGISEHKFDKAMKELVKFGYVKKSSTYGQYFHYTVSEYGNLNKEEPETKAEVTDNQTSTSPDTKMNYLDSEQYEQDKESLINFLSQRENYLNMQLFKEAYNKVITRDDFFKFRRIMEKNVETNKRKHAKLMKRFIYNWPVRQELKDKTFKEVKRLITDEHKKPSENEVLRIRIKIGRDKYKNKVKRYGYDLETQEVDRYENPLD